MSNFSLGVVMDPIDTIVPAKDSTLAMLLAAQERGYEILYFEQADLRISDGEPWGTGRPLQVRDSADDWHEFGDLIDICLGELDVILMRKDPPFDTEYIYSTYILERAELAGALIVNRPGYLLNLTFIMSGDRLTLRTPETGPRNVSGVLLWELVAGR